MYQHANFQKTLEFFQIIPEVTYTYSIYNYLSEGTPFSRFRRVVSEEFQRNVYEAPALPPGVVFGRFPGVVSRFPESPSYKLLRLLCSRPAGGVVWWNKATRSVNLAPKVKGSPAARLSRSYRYIRRGEAVERWQKIRAVRVGRVLPDQPKNPLDRGCR